MISKQENPYFGSHLSILSNSDAGSGIWQPTLISISTIGWVDPPPPLPIHRPLHMHTTVLYTNWSIGHAVSVQVPEYHQCTRPIYHCRDLIAKITLGHFATSHHPDKARIGSPRLKALSKLFCCMCNICVIIFLQFCMTLDNSNQKWRRRICPGVHTGYSSKAGVTTHHWQKMIVVVWSECKVYQMTLLL